MAQYEPTYWNHKGLFEAEYQELHSRLVPREGIAITTHGEILRIACNIYYDIYNNGGGNISNNYLSQCCEWLVANVHPSMRDSAKKFISIRQKHLNPKVMKFMDAFMDYIIKYVVWQDKSAIELKELAFKASWSEK